MLGYDAEDGADEVAARSTKLTVENTSMSTPHVRWFWGCRRSKIAPIIATIPEKIPTKVMTAKRLKMLTLASIKPCSLFVMPFIQLPNPPQAGP
jgi:hypothetical protein